MCNMMMKSRSAAVAPLTKTVLQIQAVPSMLHVSTVLEILQLGCMPTHHCVKDACLVITGKRSQEKDHRKVITGK